MTLEESREIIPLMESMIEMCIRDRCGAVHRGFSFSVSFPLLYAYFGRETNYLWKDTTIYGGSALSDVYKRQVLRRPVISHRTNLHSFSVV